MAKNREPEKPVESESEPEEEDDEVSSEEVGSSDSDTEPEQTPVTTTKILPTAPAPKKPQQVVKPTPPPPSSEEEDEEEDEEEESGSEAESDDESVNPNVKPIVSKPMDEPQKPATSAAAAARKPRSKPNASQPSTPSKAATGVKRPAEEKEGEAKDNKKSKKKPTPEAESSGKTQITVTDDSKKQLFQRLWSEDDEIVVLKGMIDYAAKKKSDPIADLNNFHDFIRSNLHVDVNRAQLQDKIRRLRKKYENNKSKEKNGKERTFTKAHEEKTYELSKKIWGSENDNGGEEDKPVANGTAGTPVRKTPSRAVIKIENSNPKEQKNLEVANPVMKMMAGISNSGYSGGGTSTRDWILKMGVEYFEGENKAEGYEEWMKLRAKEIELEDKRLELMRDQTKLMLKVFKSRSN